MKILKLALAIGILVTAGMVSATTIGAYQISETMSFSGPQPGNGSLNGVAILDDSGTLTITASGTIYTTVSSGQFQGLPNGEANVSTTDVLTGSWSIDNTFLPAGGSSSVTNCIDTDAQPWQGLCGSDAPMTSIGSSTQLQVSGGFFQIGHDVPTAGLSNNAHGLISANTASYSVDYLLTPISIPIPSAAWIFGAGLLGLIRISRKNKPK